MLVKQAEERPGYFWWGLLVGFCINIFIMSGLLYYLFFINGVTVRINRQGITNRVKAEVFRIADEKLPILLDSLRKEVPDSIGKNIDQLHEGKLYLSNMEIKFPPEMMEQLRKSIYLQTTSQLDEDLFNAERYRPIMLSIADDINSLVDQMMEQEITKRKIIWKPVNWLKIPITVVSGND